MKKPNTTKITESLATRHLYDYLRFDGKTNFQDKEVFEKVKAIYNEKIDENQCMIENTKYYKFIYGHAKKRLKTDGVIKTKGPGKNKEFEFIYSKKQPNEKNENSFEWNTNITIKNVFSFINDKQYVLPAFQRGTAWTTAKDYKELALSIYKQVPMGVMYFWEIDKTTVQEVRHYSFKRDVNTKKTLNFETLNINEYSEEKTIYSIIDGQQRITGINVIVNGTFNGKKLCFNESKVGNEMFSFRSEDHKWKTMEEIFNELNAIHIKGFSSKLIEKVSNKLDISVFSLNMLYRGFFTSNLIATCNMKGEDLLRILEVFIRVNNFGKKLNPSDLMLSFLVGNNEKEKFNIREEVNSLWELLKKYKPNFSFASVLKLVAIYFTNKSKINHTTFTSENENEKEKFKWNSKGFKNLKKSTKYVIEVLEEIGQKGKDVKSDNSLIPIIYWHSRNKTTKITNTKTKNNIHTYIIFAHLFKHFGSSTDQKLLKLIEQVKQDEDFSKWFIFKEKQNISKEVIINEIGKWSYKNNAKQISTILSLNNHTFPGSNSIEHLQPQSKKGSDLLFNLALLPLEINSSIRDLDINKKIDKLSLKYGKTKKEIKKSLIFNKDNDARVSEIADLIINKISK